MIFKIFQVSLCEPRKIFENFGFCGKITKKGYLSFRKIPTYGYILLVKLPLNMGMGLELPAAHPRPIQTGVPRQGLAYLIRLNAVTHYNKPLKLNVCR